MNELIMMLTATIIAMSNGKCPEKIENPIYNTGEHNLVYEDKDIYPNKPVKVSIQIDGVSYYNSKYPESLCELARRALKKAVR